MSKVQIFNIALNILGVIRFYMNDYGQSIEYLHQATKPINDMYAKDSVVFSGEYAELLNNLGYITYVAKDYDKSLDYYNQSLSLRRKDYKRLPNLHYENELVRMGKDAVPSLVDSLQVVKGKTRGIVAMVLIRIGESSIDYLRRAAETNSEFEWVANYLITEINGAAA